MRRALVYCLGYASIAYSWQHVFIPSESESCDESCFTTSVKAFQTVKSPIWFSTSPFDSFSRSKMSAVNDSAWEHWYFETVSESGDVFLTSFARDPSYRLFGNGVLRLELRFAWANGTSVSFVEFVDESMVTDCCGAVRGIWKGKNKTFTFSISSDMKTAIVDLESSSIKGRVRLESFGPSRYPDGSIWPSRTATTQLSPYLHFTEAIVAAHAFVDFTVHGSQLKFRGHGGHIHFWAAFDWFKIVMGWRCARGIAGPYAFQFWHPIPKLDAGNEYQSAMLLENGKPIFTASGALQNIDKDSTNHVIIERENLGIAHSAFVDPSSSWKIDFVAPSSGRRWSFLMKHQTLAMDITFGNASSATYFTDTVVGGEVDGEEHVGYSLSEQAFFPPTLGADFMFQVWSYFLAETKATVMGSLWSTSQAILREIIKTVVWKIAV
ncbi:hypothetical protein CC78DRAFT_454550 [Lojkania enalia]|uniref:Uncharacterized protein n=1 Tax=Lojkania enalia TaxID=147567 RepID=A0A9P4KHD3_9PLEO|nr:hypothetical protein CC78DRAFT_454550 [Didymosphaeria enalia]